MVRIACVFAIIENCAGVAELADATVLGAVGATREGSSPFARTKKALRREINMNMSIFYVVLIIVGICVGIALA